MTPTAIPQPAVELSALLKLATVTGIDTPLTVDEIDTCIADFDAADKLFKTAKDSYDERKAILVALVAAQGSPVPHAEQSRRILGRRNVASITTGTTVTVHEDNVAELQHYLFDTNHSDIFPQLFATTVKHTLIDGARSVLSTIKLPNRVHDKVLSLFGQCFDIKPKSPSLKVTAIDAVKPARKSKAKASAEKAAA